MIFKVKRSLKIYQVNNGMLLNILSLNHNKFNFVFYRHIVNQLDTSPPNVIKFNYFDI